MILLISDVYRFQQTIDVDWGYCPGKMTIINALFRSENRPIVVFEHKNCKQVLSKTINTSLCFGNIFMIKNGN